jgi:hypothetical protein
MADGKSAAAGNAATIEIPTHCFICGSDDTRYIGDVKSRAVFRKNPIMVCRYCRDEYEDAIAQATAYGHRFRFVRKDEIPAITQAQRVSSPMFRYRPFRQIYKVLTLLKEREENRKKEVNWMVDEMTQKLLKLHGRVAAAMKDTFVVRGDDAKMPDDVALLKIKDLLEEIDPEVFSNPGRKGRGKRLSKA